MPLDIAQNSTDIIFAFHTNSSMILEVFSKNNCQLMKKVH